MVIIVTNIIMGVELMKNYLLAFLGGDYDMEEQQANNGKELLEAVHTARQEWVAAQSYFENVSDPECHIQTGGREKKIYVSFEPCAEGGSG